MRRLIQPDGSLVVAADINFPVPGSPKNVTRRRVMTENRLRQGCVQSFADLLSSERDTDCTIIVSHKPMDQLTEII